MQAHMGTHGYILIHAVHTDTCTHGHTYEYTQAHMGTCRHVSWRPASVGVFLRQVEPGLSSPSQCPCTKDGALCPDPGSGCCSGCLPGLYTVLGDRAVPWGLGRARKGVSTWSGSEVPWGWRGPRWCGGLLEVLRDAGCGVWAGLMVFKVKFLVQFSPLVQGGAPNVIGARAEPRTPPPHLNFLHFPSLTPV